MTIQIIPTRHMVFFSNMNTYYDIINKKDIQSKNNIQNKKI